MPAPNSQAQPNDAKHRNGEHADFAAAQTSAHEKGHGNSHGDGKDAPRTSGQCLHHHQRKNGQQNDHNRQHADERQCSHAGSDLFLHHLAQRLPTATDGGKQDNHVMHSSAQGGADQNPERPGQKSELRCQHRSDQRPWPGNGRKVMTKNHPAVRRHEILAVIAHEGGRGALIIKDEQFRRQPLAVEAVTDRERAQPGDDDPESAHRLSARESENRNGHHSENADCHPKQFLPETHRQTQLTRNPAVLPQPR